MKCKTCSGVFEAKSGGRPRLFCDECRRMRAYRLYDAWYLRGQNRENRLKYYIDYYNAHKEQWIGYLKRRKIDVLVSEAED